MIVPPEAVLTGRSAATVQGVELAGPNDPVEFVVPEGHRFGPIRGLRVRRTEVTRSESTEWHGIRLATPLRTAIDLLLRHSPRTHARTTVLRTGVADLDAYLRANLVSRAELEQSLQRRRNRGVVVARQAESLADTRAESRPESEVRVLLRLNDLAPTPQVEVHDGEQLLGRLDLALEHERVAIEYDGRWHNTRKQARYDRSRRARLEHAGWTFVIVDADKLAQPEELIKEVLAAIRYRRRLSRIAS